ncbi:MAG: ABC transporter permease [Clostridia bacterium]
MKANKGIFINGILKPIFYVILALLISGIIILLTGKDPILAMVSLGQGAVGGKRQLAETLLKMVPLLLCGLSVAIAYRTSFFNIGAEGQFLMGALAATWFAVGFDLPAIIMLPMTFVVGALAGGIWCLIVGIIKIKTGASEIINTIMFNYIALRLVGWAVNGPLKDGYLPQSSEVNSGAVLPILWQGTRLHIGFLIALALAFILQFILFKTVFGYQIRAVGLNLKAANYAGIKSAKRLIQTCLISGGLAGLAGAIELMGVTKRLFEIFSPGYGYDAIAVSLLAQNNPAGVILSSLLFAVLRGGAGQMQRNADVSFVIIYVIQALIIVFVVMSSSDKNSNSVIQKLIQKISLQKAEKKVDSKGGA